MTIFLFSLTLLSQSFFFLIAHTSFLSTPLFKPSPSTQNIEPRQAPAVIAASDFLRRGYQASVVAGNWVYIDGGEYSFLSNGTPHFQYASTLLSIDLSRNWTNATVAIQSTTKPNGAPNLNSPSLWYHESEGLIYSGFTGWNSSFGDDPELPPLSLWTLKPDGTGSGAWNEIIPSQSSEWSHLTRPAQPLMAFGQVSAWILGGISTEWNGWASPENLIPDMIQFDMGSRLFSNLTVQCCNATGGIYKGALHYVPSFGPSGIHIAMGGQNGIGNNGVTAGLIDFGTVSVFDPAQRAWWNQTTTGSKPSPRVEFCTAGVNSTNGTYEIFVYAGWGTHLGAAAIQYDTINILTLPAFHWISVPYNPENPRHALSCNAVGGSQILTIGGVDSNSQVATGIIEDIIESTFDSSPDPFAQGLAIFDMTTLAFSDQYTAGAPPYKQSDVVQQFYSQSNGSYTYHLTPQVSALLQVTNFANASAPSSQPPDQPTPPPSDSPTSGPSQSHGLKAGAIAGIVVGCSAALAIAAGIAFLFKRRTQNDRDVIQDGNPVLAKIEKLSETDGTQVGELDGQGQKPLEKDGTQVEELDEQGQGIPELGHTEPPVELQALPYCRQD